MIKGDESLAQVVSIDEKLIPVFEKYGLGLYFKPENLKKTGHFMRLNTLLKSKGIDSAAFLNMVNQMLGDKQATKPRSTVMQNNLHFTAMLPCGLRNPFKEFTEAYLAENTSVFSSLNYLIEGNVNHELSYYPILDSIENVEELPDIILASDVNNFFHRPFTERFINRGIFRACLPYTPNSYLQSSGYSDPDGNFTMYTANMLVMVVDKTQLGKRPMPEKWEDLLQPEFENSIIMRGEDNFFCNAVMLPFFKDKGMDAIKVLARNIKRGLHPAEMVKLAGKNSEEGAAVYIMPWFFSKRIKNQNVEVIWPEDGAIASPVFLLVKKDKIIEHKDLLSFLFSEKTGQMLKERHFPTMHPSVNQSDFPKKISWLGWDFLKKHDIGKLKEDIRSAFMGIWNIKTYIGLSQEGFKDKALFTS